MIGIPNKPIKPSKTGIRMHAGQLREKIGLAVLVAILASAGSIIGIFITSNFESNRLKDQVARERFIKQTELLERTLRVLVEMDGLDDYLKMTEVSLDDQEASSEQKRSATLETDKRVKEVEAEFEAVLVLNTIFFGPETDQAIQVLYGSVMNVDEDKHWWEVDPELGKIVVGLMGEELQE